MIDAAEREKVARELAKWLLVRVSHLGILTLESPQCVAEISERMALCANEALEKLTEQDVAEAYQNAPNWRGVLRSLKIRALKAEGIEKPAQG